MTFHNNKVLREHVLDLLIGEGAHLNFEGAVKGMPADLRGKRPDGAAHSPWEVLEHMRIAQWDILEFVRNPNHVSPGGNLREIADLVANESADLLAPIPHANGKTLLREALLAADHNAYHLGELVTLRRVLGAWNVS